MDRGLNQQTKKVIDTLYHWLFNEPAYDSSTASHATACVKSYLPTEDFSNLHGANYRVGGVVDVIQGKAAAVASSASSAAASLIDSANSRATAASGQHGRVAQSVSQGYHQLVERIQSMTSPAFWHQYDPSAAWSSFVSGQMSNFQGLSAHSILNDLTQRSGLQPHILFLLLLLPLVALLLIACAMMGAGHTGGEEPEHYGSGGSGNKTEPLKSNDKEGQGSSSPSKQGGRSSAVASTSGAGKAGKKSQGSKKGGAQNEEVVVGGQQYQVSNSGRRASWGSMLAATGFRGEETADYHPHDASPLEDPTTKDHSGHFSKHGDTAPHVSQSSGAKAPMMIRRESALNGEGLVSTIMEDFVGPSDLQHEEDEIDLDNYKEYIEGVSPADTPRARSKTSVSIETAASPKTRFPRAYGFKEADRHRHQPHVSLHEHHSCQQNLGSMEMCDGYMGQTSIASRIMDLAQENTIVKNLDGISGGVLGATIATVAALTNTAQAAAHAITEKIPRPSNDANVEKQEASYKAQAGKKSQSMDVSNLNASENIKTAKKSKDHNHDNQDENKSTEPVVAANAPRLRQRSIPHGQPTVANPAVSAKTSSKNSISTKSTIMPDPRKKSSVEDISCNHAGHVVLSASAPAEGETPCEKVDKNAPCKPKQYDVEDISVGPKTFFGIWADPIIHNDKGKTQSKKFGQPGEDMAVPAQVASPDNLKHAEALEHNRMESGLSKMDERKGYSAMSHGAGAAKTNNHAGADSATFMPLSPNSNMGPRVEEAVTKIEAAVQNSTEATKSMVQKSAGTLTQGVSNLSTKSAPDKGGAMDPPRNGKDTLTQSAKQNAEHAKKTAVDSAPSTKNTTAQPIERSGKKSGSVVKSVSQDTKTANATKVSTKKTKKSLLDPSHARDAKIAIDSALAYAETTKNAATISAKRSVAKAEDEARTAALEAKQVVDSALAYAQRTKDAALKNVKEATAGTDRIIHKDAIVAKEAADSKLETASDTKEAFVKGVENSTTGAQNNVQTAVTATKKAIDSKFASSEKTRDADIETVQNAVVSAENAIVSAENAIVSAKNAFEKAGKHAKKAINSMTASTQKTEQSAVKSAKKSFPQVEKTVQDAALEGKNDIQTKIASAYKAEENAVIATKASVLSTEKTVEKAVRVAQKAIDSTVASVRQTEEAAIKGAKKSVVNAMSAGQKAVESFEKEGIAAKAQAVKASEAAYQKAKKAENITNTVEHGAIVQTQATVDSAMESALKAKEVTGNKATGVVQGVVGQAKAAVHTATGTVQYAKSTFDSAIGSAQYAKDAAVQKATGVVQGAVDQAVATVQHAKDTAVYKATERVQGAVDAAKNAITQTVIEPVKNAEQLIGSAVEIGRGTIDAGIRGAREAAEKYDHDAKQVAKQAEKSVEAAKRERKKTSHNAEHTMDATLTTGPAVEKHIKSSSKSVEPEAKATPKTISAQSSVPKDDEQSGSSRDLLSSAKHLTGGLGDAFSEVMSHAGGFMSQSVISVKDNTADFLGAAKNDILKAGLGHHDSKSHHSDLWDIMKEAKQSRHFHGISASDSPAAKKASQVAREYYESLRGEGSNSTGSSASATSTTFSLSASPASCTTGTSRGGAGRKEVQENPEKVAKSLRDRSITLDHDEYVFRDKNGDLVSAEELDDGSDADDEEGYDDDDQKDGNSGILAKAPRIVHSAKTAAAAMAARVADVSYENLDIAKASISEIVDNVKEALAGSDEHREEDSGEEAQDEMSSSSAQDSVHPRSSGIGEIRKSDKNIAEDEEPSALSTDMEHRMSTSFPTSSNVDMIDIHTFKPNLKSRHVDQDGFIMIEDRQHSHEHYERTSSLDIDRENKSASVAINVSSSSSPHRHVDTPAASRPDSAAVSGETTPMSRPLTSGRAKTGKLSYSGATKIHLSEDDHGARLGLTETHQDGNKQQQVSFQDLFFEDYEKSPPTTLASASNQLLQQLIHPHNDGTTINNANIARRYSGSSGPATTTVSLAHGHGLLQGVDKQQGHESGPFRSNDRTSDQREGGQGKEFGLDERGQKVAVDARRDSGFNLLV